ncbi:ribose-phosphate pyrophosphokinase-like domain-containing protein [Candidatus Woesearchaeota archaeon]|nr:ribose-phosphate pyrophosphokinase-like domain-containing protein [Candidatus Woesearchaeota archaeon]
MATKLLLIPCSSAETVKLTKEVGQILRKDHGLEGKVEILFSSQRKKIAPGISKNHTHHLVGDYFADAEVNADIGRNQLYDEVRGTHVVLIEHMLTPNRKLSEGSEQIVSVNDHLMTLRGFLDLVSNTETLHRTLVTPYLAYVRSHSIEKYRKDGFFQFDSLRKMMTDFNRDNLSSLITIDPHSDKVKQIAEELGIDFHSINPFQSARAINPYKLGLEDKTKAKEVLKHLRPFQERFLSMKESHKGHFYVISVDDGTEHRVENFVERAFTELSTEDAYSLIAYKDKTRSTYIDSSSKFKDFSQIREDNIDPKGVYIIIDDMCSSSKTSEKGAKVELWTTHAVTMPEQYEKANKRDYITKIVCLDTVPQRPELNIEFIKSSAYLLAAQLYKVHAKLEGARE